MPSSRPSWLPSPRSIAAAPVRSSPAAPASTPISPAGPCFRSARTTTSALLPTLSSAAAAAAAAGREGFGASAARLVSGDLPAHRSLEASLAHFLDRPAALAFPSGYQTNIGALTALAGRDDLIVSDELNHASLVDGCRLSRARIAIYRHGDARAAGRLLRAGARFRRRLLVTESLFSMDGDAAPLPPSRTRPPRPTASWSSTRRTPWASLAPAAAASAPRPASSPTS